MALPAGLTQDTPPDTGPEARSLAEARRLVADCHRCDLYKNATQTVFGEGPQSATAMLVGEQPGDREDLEGHPFVGPASAARAIFGRPVTIGREHGRPLPFRDGVEGFVTVHPSFNLRQRSSEGSEREYARLVKDLVQIAERIHAARR